MKIIKKCIYDINYLYACKESILINYETKITFYNKSFISIKFPFNTSLYTSAINHTFSNAREKSAKSHWRFNSLSLRQPSSTNHDVSRKRPENLNKIILLPEYVFYYVFKILIYINFNILKYIKILFNITKIVYFKDRGQIKTLNKDIKLIEFPLSYIIYHH